MKKSRIALTALAAATVLGVAACGSDAETGSSQDTGTTSSSQSSPSDPSQSSDETASESSTQSPESGKDASAVISAIDAAESQTGGTAYEVDDENGSWEIDLAKDGTSIEVEVSPDGTVTRQKKEDLDADDRKGLAAAKTTIAQGIEKALDEVDGTFDEAELEEEGGTYYWEVEIVTGSEGDREVLVDVANGKVSVQN
ncbi:PepSY domain-containing protein [Janibacter cremeus]|uniref:Putative membrane protein YkoI n=1 Tax=Janibacter cremeus TaxID=1285192 RepID=A0A852VLH3_9MICO|nr:PepSY domain-containing protein [Janibacter cremeus]NYF97872.1 putative membrane protein YkoI [Janibacter cremeus]